MSFASPGENLSLTERIRMGLEELLNLEFAKKKGLNASNLDLDSMAESLAREAEEKKLVSPVVDFDIGRTSLPFCVRERIGSEH